VAVRCIQWNVQKTVCAYLHRKVALVKEDFKSQMENLSKDTTAKSRMSTNRSSKPGALENRLYSDNRAIEKGIHRLEVIHQGAIIQQPT
jgi:hypothetical protein